MPVRKKQLSHTFENIISLENLCLAWEEFIIGKKKKLDVIEFSRDLMDNIVKLHEDLVKLTYRHGGYKSFFVNDPKRRHIHKASVRDRLVHHAVYRILYPFFDNTFIADSFSCRVDKGTHRALNRFRKFYRQVSKNNTRSCWVLKCDIRKFFASIDHKILMDILVTRISDKNILGLLENIIDSYHTNCHPRESGDPVYHDLDSRFHGNDSRVGLPLGNLTSQLFANVFLDKLDQFVKHTIKAKFYIRYADDFVFLSDNKLCLEDILPVIDKFLQNNLHLTLHPQKIFLQTVASGVDFLGWVNFSNYRIIRRTTKRRMLDRIKDQPTDATFQSYLGLLKHGNTFSDKRELEMWYWLFGG